MRLSNVGAALILLAIPTLASAHAGNNDPAMVHVCIGNASKIVRVVGVSGSCISSPLFLAETPAHWPQTQGTGAQGPKGDQGIPGTNGADGASVVFVGYLLAGDATCPNGGVVYSSGNPPTNAFVCNGRDATTGATRPDGPCFIPSGRYADCGNGTVTDTVTGLIWLKQVDCLPNAMYAAANEAAASLKDGDCGLTDGSSPGDWRLPTGAEWSETLAKAISLGCKVANGTEPTLTDTAGFQCMSYGGTIFVGVQSTVYSGSSTYVDHVGLVVSAFLNHGAVNAFGKGNALAVWPVRSGAR
jgi:hypothetical protein